jgi:hypothetical protein
MDPEQCLLNLLAHHYHVLGAEQLPAQCADAAHVHAHLDQACVDAARNVDQLAVQILLHYLLLLFKTQGLGLQHKTH